VILRAIHALKDHRLQWCCHSSVVIAEWSAGSASRGSLVGALIHVGSKSLKVFGIGTDIVECLRIAQMIERHGQLFIGRVYTAREIEYCSSRKAATQHYAGRWAAKEAVLKAMGTGWIRGITWRDVEVRNEAGGRPTIALAGGAREICEERGITDMQISISHCRTHATAYALALGVDESEF